MRSFYSDCRKMFSRVLPVCGILLFAGYAHAFSGEVTLYTPYTKISVAPGESIDYTIDVINKSRSVQAVNLAIVGFPKDWEYELKAGGWKISELAVLPDEKKTVSLHVAIPANVKKGTYRFNVQAPGRSVLALTVEISEHGTFKTEFTTRQPNMEGNANATFNYNAELKNRTAEQQLYALRADAPRGWNVHFKTAGRQVSSVQVASNATETIAIEIDPPDGVEAGSYKLPVTAFTNSTSAQLELEVVVKGSYSLELTTPTGLLSTGVTAGGERRLELIIKNTGSVPLENINLTSSTPVNWNVTFDPRKVERLEAGNTASLTATIQADESAIAGDYVTNLEAKTPEASSKASIRVSVRTPMLASLSGIVIILGVIGGVYYLFRTYGRR